MAGRKAFNQLSRTKKLNDSASMTELEALRDLHMELAKTGRLGDLTNQSKLARKAIAYCIRQLDEVEDRCTCLRREQGDCRLPCRWICPACERAKAVLRIFLQLEGLSVRRAAIEETFFRDLIKAKAGLWGDPEARPLDFVALVRAAHAGTAEPPQQPLPVTSSEVIESPEPPEPIEPLESPDLPESTPDESTDAPALPQLPQSPDEPNDQEAAAISA